MCIVQVKVVVPNVTIGMIIGKGGCFIKQIKDETGAYVQISQKSQDSVLVERVVTIAGFLYVHLFIFMFSIISVFRTLLNTYDIIMHTTLSIHKISMYSCSGADFFFASGCRPFPSLSVPLLYLPLPPFFVLLLPCPPIP